MVLWRHTRPSRTNTKKRCPFHHRGLECTSRKSRNTWSNRESWTWSTEWSRAKVNRVLPRESTGHSKHPLPTIQEKTTHGHHQMVNTEIRLIMISVAKDREALYSQQKQNQELTVAQIMNSLIAKFRLKLKKVGKTTRLSRYDLNQIPYNYMVEVTSRFKGLDLIDRVPEEVWTEVHNTEQEVVIKTIPKKKKCKRQTVVCVGLTNSWKSREAKGKGEKERYSHLNADFQRIARREKKAFLRAQCKEIEENNRVGKTRTLFKKIRDTKGTFHAKMGSIKEINGMDLTEAEDIKKWQEYSEELYKKDFNDPDNHNGAITQIEPDILDCKIKWAWETSLWTKQVGVMEFQVS